MMARSLMVLVLGLLISGNVHAKGGAPSVNDEGSAQDGAQIGGITLTGYSANCPEFDGPVETGGGKDESPSGLKPRAFTLEKPGGGYENNVVLIAIPQDKKGEWFRKCFKLEQGDTSDLQGKIFFAGDFYGTGSNGHIKMDVSHECTPAVKNFKHEGASATVVACPAMQSTADGDRVPAGR